MHDWSDAWENHLPIWGKVPALVPTKLVQVLITRIIPISPNAPQLLILSDQYGQQLAAIPEAQPAKDTLPWGHKRW